ncbi:hypothetical protein ABPG72_004685 [Tetrahymena utriculariae]
MELENFNYPALNSARSNSDQFDQTEGDSQQFDLSLYNSSNTSFSQASSYNSYSSPYANNYQQQQQQYHYQMRVQQQYYYNQQQQQIQQNQQQQYYQYHFNQGMLQYHHVPMQQQVSMFPIQQQSYYQQPYYPQQQYPQQYKTQAYVYPQSFDQHQYYPQVVQHSSSNLSASSCSSYSSKQQTPEQSGKNIKMEAMRKRLSCVDTGKGGLILKQFGKRNSTGNNIPTFNSNFQPQY